MEKHESNGERSVGEWGERTPIPKEKTDLAEPTWLLTWAPLVFSVTWREREKNEGEYVFYGVWRTIT